MKNEVLKFGSCFKFVEFEQTMKKVGAIDIVPYKLSEEQYKRYLQVELYFKCKDWNHCKQYYYELESKYVDFFKTFWILYGSPEIIFFDNSLKIKNIRNFFENKENKSINWLIEQSQNKKIRIDLFEQFEFLLKISFRGCSCIGFMYKEVGLTFIPNWLSINIYEERDSLQTIDEIKTIASSRGLWLI